MRDAGDLYEENVKNVFICKSGYAEMKVIALSLKGYLQIPTCGRNLQVIGQIGTLIFIANFVLYITTSLPRTGRIARSNKSLSYIVSDLDSLPFSLSSK